MKILFLIGNNPVDAVKTWDEIKKYKDAGYHTPSKDYVSIFKAMEKNEELVQEILTAREKVGLPSTGLTWNDYYENYYLKSLSVYDEKVSKKYQDFFSKVKSEAKRIVKKHKPHDYIERQLENIIIGSFVFPEDIPIEITATPVDELDMSQGNSNVLLKISHPVTPNELKTYIGNNWLKINALMDTLPTEPKYYISKRDMRIVELKDTTKLDWNEIIQKVTEEFKLDDYEGKLNLISVKRAYNRAKVRIKNTTNKSTSDK